MALRILLAVLHLIALGIGLAAVWARARSLGARPLEIAGVRRAFVADTWWGIAAGLWIATGLWRLFGETEKSTAYYFGNHVFLAKMGFLAMILALEIWPMITLIRWRRTLGREGLGWVPSESIGQRISAISYVEAVLVMMMVTAAASMTRGLGS